MSDYVDQLSFSDSVLQQPYIEQIRIDSKTIGGGIQKRVAYVDTCLIVSPEAAKFFSSNNNQYEYLKLSVLKIVKNNVTVNYVNSLVNGNLPNPFPRGTTEKYDNYIEYKEVPFSEILSAVKPNDTGLAKYRKYKKAIIFDLSEDEMFGLHFATFVTLKDNNDSLDRQVTDGPPVIGPIRLYQATDDSGGFSNESNILLTSDNKIWAGSYHVMANEDGSKTYMKGLVHDKMASLSNQTLTLSKLSSIPFVLEMNSLFSKNLKSLNRNSLITKKSYTPTFVKSSLQRSSASSPAELALFFDDNKDASERILEQDLDLRGQGKISSVTSGLFTEGRSFPLITKPSSKIQSLQTMSSQIENLNNRQAISTISTETTKKENSSLLASVSEISQPLSTKIINNNKLNAKNTSRNFRLKKSQRIKPTSEVYTSVTENNEVLINFIADKINILKSLSKFQSIVDEMEESELEKALELTYLKNLSIQRVADLVGTKITETVFDKQMNRELNTPGLENSIYFNRLFKTGEPVKVATFRVEKNVFDQNRMTLYSIIDHRIDSLIKNEFNYDIEMEFTDGIKEIVYGKLKILEKNIKIIKNIYDFCVSNTLFFGNASSMDQSPSTGYNIFRINEKSKRAIQNLVKTEKKIPSNLQNSNFLDGRIKTAIASYVDLVSLFIPKQFTEPRKAFQLLYEKIGFLSGTREGIEEFLKNCDLLVKQIKEIDNTTKSYENSVYFRKRTFSRGKNTKQFLKFTTKTKKVKVITENSNGLDYLPNLKEVGSPYPDILFNSFSNLISFKEDPLIEPKFLVATKNKINLTLNSPIQNYTLMNNQKNMVANLSLKRTVNNIEAEESETELLEKERILDFLSANGIYIKEFSPEKIIKETKEIKSKLDLKNKKSDINPSILKKTSEILKSSPGFTETYTPTVTKIDPEIITVDYTKSKNLDFDPELANIAASLTINTGTNKRIKRNLQPNDIAPYVLSNCFNVRVQYLSGFKMRGSINLFDEDWISLDLSTESRLNTKNMFCRLLEIDKNSASIGARNELQTVTLNSHFFLLPSTLKQGVVVPSQQRNLSKSDGKVFVNADSTMDSADLQTFSRSTSEIFISVPKDPETLDLFTIQDLERMFNLSIPIKQPNNVTVFGTNFSPAPSKIIRGTKGELNKSSAQIISSLFNSGTQTQNLPVNTVKTSNMQMPTIPTKFNYSGE